MPSQAERRAATTGAILASARALFAERGFEATSIDDIAEVAGVAKGAVYHHFHAKEAIFLHVLDAVQAEIAAAPMPAEFHKITDPIEGIVAAVLQYLLTVTEPAARRIVLIDGPVVIGWARWREIDDRHFGGGAKIGLRLVLGPGAPEPEVEASTRLIMGAVMEACLVCATAQDPAGAARAFTGVLKKMLEGLRR